MTRSIYQFYTRATTGEIVPNAEVSVFFAGAGEAPIYDAETGGSLITQPLIATTSAKAVFYIEPGIYDVQSKDPILLTTATFVNEEIGTSREALIDDNQHAKPYSPINKADANEVIYSNPAISSIEVRGAIDELIVMDGQLSDSISANLDSIDELFIRDEITTSELINSTVVYGSTVKLNTAGFTASGDSGSGSWIQNGVTGQTVSQSPAQLADALLNDGNGNQWGLVFDGAVDPLSLGAKTDGSDSYLALQAGLNGGKVIDLKTNFFSFDGTLTSDQIGAGIIGSGSMSCGLNYISTTLDAVHFALASGPLRGASLKGFSLTPVAASVTNTAIKLDGVRLFTIDDVVIDKSFIGLHLLGCAQGVVSKLLCINELDNGGVINGRRYVLIEETANPNVVTKHPGDLFFSDFNGRCGGTPYVEFGVEIHSSDGIWFTGYHIGNCFGANILIDADRPARCTGIKFSDGWNDIGTGSGVIIRGNTSPSNSNYTFSSVKNLGGNVGLRGFDIDGSATDIVISGADTEISGYKREGVKIAATFTGDVTLDGKVYNCCLQSPATYDVVKDDSAVSFSFVGGSVESPNARWLINSQAGKAELNISNVEVIGTGSSGKVAYIEDADCRVRDIKGFNPVGLLDSTFGASPFLYTNTKGYPIQVNIYGGSGVSFELNGTALGGGKDELSTVLAPGDSVETTYSSLPLFYPFGL